MKKYVVTGAQVKFISGELGLSDEGGSKEKYTSVFDEVDVLAKKYSVENKIDYDKAVFAVLKSNKDLSEKYMKA